MRAREYAALAAVFLLLIIAKSKTVGTVELAKAESKLINLAYDLRLVHQHPKDLAVHEVLQR
jgi:hypothetical protein